MASPIFFPKSPTGMGSATSAGGGADLSALGFTQIDLTSGFTLTDPDSLVSSTVALAGGVMQVTMNALGSGSNDYAWTSSTVQRAPRWTAPLYAIDANGANVRITTGDEFLLTTVIEFVEPVDRFTTEIVVASAEDGTALTSGGNKAQGGLLQYTPSGNPRMGCFTGNSLDFKSSANNHRNFATAIHGGGRGQAVSYVNLDNTVGQINGGSRNSGLTFSNTTTDMNLMVGLGVWNFGTVSAGEDAKLKLWYRAIKFSLP